MLEIDAITFRYPGSDVEFSFDMTVAPGEIVGLTGPSGSGKSTLFDLVAGFLHPASGDITLNGTSIVRLAPEDRPVSLLFQTDNLFEHLSAGANVALGLAGRVKPDDARVSNALAQMNLEGLGGRRAANLSGGQKQRVALARTVLRDKPVLLLDEPFSGLDEQTAAPIRAMIDALVREKGWHAILISHDRKDIASLASRSYTIRDGRTQALDDQ
jgi:thiamine transport system ATP-binding protein